MIRIHNVEQLRAADAYTIEHTPIASIDLMERAATACTEWILKRFHPGQSFTIVCGQGNNGGDGLAVARLLHARGKKITVCIAENCGKQSVDFSANIGRLPKEVTLLRLNKETPTLPVSTDDTVYIDALFGSGLNREADSQAADLIEQLNKSGKTIIAIDIPSGLFADRETSLRAPVVNATFTLTFQSPKQAFFYAEYARYTGEWHVLDIGLDTHFLADQKGTIYQLEEADLATTLKARPAYGHKGTFGHALLLAGSLGKTGAAQLAAKACLRSGAGRVTVRTPECGLLPLQIGVAEAMVNPDEEEQHLSTPLQPGEWQAIGVGPGIGTHHETANVLKRLLQDSAGPFVLDADALNILSDNKTWLHFLPQGTILTPHPGEFERLAGKIENPFDRTAAQLEFAHRYHCYVLLKGQYSALACPDGTLVFNATGNSGMATAGSGDVLTGVITALCAQGYSPFTAAFCGMYLHGLAGDMAAVEIGQTGMIAGDIIEFLPSAFRYFGK